MKIIPLDLAGADFCIGALYDSDDAVVLTDDMLFVQVRNFGIDVSWYPEHDPNGRYVITVFRETWEKQIRQYPTTDAHEVARIVEQQIRLLTEPVVTISDAEDEPLTEQVWPERNSGVTALVAGYATAGFYRLLQRCLGGQGHRSALFSETRRASSTAGP